MATQRDEKKGPVIALDGPGGVGKTTVSRLVARRLGLRYVDTGAMYRALALAVHDCGVDIENEEALENFCARVKIKYEVPAGSVSVNDRDYTHRIRTPEASRLASLVSKKRPVRKTLVSYQRTLAAAGSVVMEGLDIGTVVLPRADIKFFLDARPHVRALRRHIEIKGEGEADSVEVARELDERDRRDTEREASPLKRADDAILIDTTELDIEGVLEEILGHIKERLKVGDTRS